LKLVALVSSLATVPPIQNGPVAAFSSSASGGETATPTPQRKSPAAAPRWPTPPSRPPSLACSLAW
jgi:hypothetical protein